jgi:hypothetical protein
MRTALLLVAMLAGAVIAMALGGCARAAATAHWPAAPAAGDRVTPGLVVPSPLLLTMAGDEMDRAEWEHARNEVSRRLEPPAGAAERTWLEVRQREHLRTINGRPGEFTSTITRSIRRRVH